MEETCGKYNCNDVDRYEQRTEKMYGMKTADQEPSLHPPDLTRGFSQRLMLLFLTLSTRPDFYMSSGVQTMWGFGSDPSGQRYLTLALLQKKKVVLHSLDVVRGLNMTLT